MSDDLMVDLETLSTSPAAAIVQIGACFFDRYTGSTENHFSVRCKASRKYDISPDTIGWWMLQDDGARKSVFAGEAGSVADAILQFDTYVRTRANSSDFRIWGMPAAFDVVILENAYRVEGLSIPWKYNASRDCRTIFEAAGLGKEDLYKPHVAHNALSDAIAQAKSVALAFSILRGESNVE